MTSSPNDEGEVEARYLRGWRAAGGIIVGALLTGIAFENLDSPFGWLGILWFVVCLWLMQCIAASIAKVILLNLGFVFLVPGLFELYLGAKAQPEMRPDIPEEHKARDDEVGYRLKKNTATHVMNWVGDELVYDAVYTLDGNGLRVSPPFRPAIGSMCLLFFGGSFTFGTGVQDDQTSPFLTGVVTDHRHRIYNFGYAGYGPHQMLAVLESERVEKIVDCTITHVIYQSVYDHVRRVAGRAHWDVHGPRYELVGDGRVRRNGNFDDGPPRFNEAWPRLARSNLARMLADDFEPSEADFRRLAGVVEAARDTVRARFPAAEFHVLLWNKPWKHNAYYWEELLRREIALHFMSVILPDYPERRKRYGIGPHDGHPNPVTNRIIALYVACEILDEELGADCDRSQLASSLDQRAAQR